MTLFCSLDSLYANLSFLSFYSGKICVLLSLFDEKGPTFVVPTSVSQREQALACMVPRPRHRNRTTEGYLSNVTVLFAYRGDAPLCFGGSYSDGAQIKVRLDDVSSTRTIFGPPIWEICASRWSHIRLCHPFVWSCYPLRYLSCGRRP